MSYTVHTTNAFVLSSISHGEANKMYHLFTRDFGLVIATAQGIRLSKSKLRPHLLDYALSAVSLVKGRDFWRITSANSIYKSKDKKYVQILSVIKRLLQGEGEHALLFDYLRENLLKENIDETEVMIKILYELGYVNEKEIKDADQKKLISLINKGLKESQL